MDAATIPCPDGCNNLCYFCGASIFIEGGIIPRSRFGICFFHSTTLSPTHVLEHVTRYCHDRSRLLLRLLLHLHEPPEQQLAALPQITKLTHKDGWDGTNIHHRDELGPLCSEAPKLGADARGGRPPRLWARIENDTTTACPLLY